MTIKLNGLSLGDANTSVTLSPGITARNRWERRLDTMVDGSRRTTLVGRGHDGLRFTLIITGADPDAWASTIEDILLGDATVTIETSQSGVSLYHGFSRVAVEVQDVSRVQPNPVGQRVLDVAGVARGAWLADGGDYVEVRRGGFQYDGTDWTDFDARTWDSAADTGLPVVVLPEQQTGYPLARATSDYSFTNPTLIRSESETFHTQAMRDSIVAHWKLDETSGSQARDSGVNSHHGTITGATVGATGQHDKALSFDGTNDTVSVSDAATLDLVNAITIEAWINPDAVTGTQQLVHKLTAGDGYSLHLNGANAAFTLDGSTHTGSATISTGQWQHVVATWDGATIRLYVDGAADGSTAATALTANAADLYLGSNAGASEWYGGDLDEVLIYDRALTAEEVSQRYNSYSRTVSLYQLTNHIQGRGDTSPPTTNLVSHYKLDETSGTSITDSAGSNTGTLTGTATLGVGGQIGTAIDFDGSTGYVDVTDDATLDLQDGLTIAAWIQPDSVTGNQQVAEKRTGANDGYFLRTNGSELNAGIGTSGGTFTVDSSSTPLSIDGWTHVAMTYDKANLRLYVNGAEVDSTAETNQIGTNTQNFVIGRRDASADSYFNGAIDEVLVYSDALTAAQISALYEAGLSANDVVRYALKSSPTKDYLDGTT